MRFYFDGYLYEQRTPTSKILKKYNDKIVERYETAKDLPPEVLQEYDLINIMTKTPEKFFYYEMKYNNVEINASIAKEKSRNIIIPATLDGYPVTSFSGESNIFQNAESVIFLNKSTYFPTHLFNKNTNLRHVIFGQDMKLVKGDFINKKNLETIVIPEKATEIPENFCLGCVNLTTINLENITKIGNAAFSKCKNLNVELPEKLEEIGIKAFYDSGLENIFFPKTIKKVGSYAFAECERVKFILKGDIDLPDNVFKNSGRTCGIEDLLR